MCNALVGNVQVSPTHLGSPLDIRVPFASSPSYARSLSAWKSWAVASHGPNPSRTPTIVQLCHTGRQSMRGGGRPFFTPSLAPSAVPVTAREGFVGWLIGQVMFGTPKAMSEEDIDEVVEAFVQGARVAKEAGFDGVQIHASHGYLLAQFMSPNVRRGTSRGDLDPLLMSSRVDQPSNGLVWRVRSREDQVALSHRRCDQEGATSQLWVCSRNKAEQLGLCRECFL
jgi:hypothetical protein